MTEHGLLEQQKLTVYSLFVLYFLLTEGPMSGYKLAQFIKERGHGRFRATAGNVYPSLHELKEAGDVEAGEPTGGHEKIVYEITERGKRDPSTCGARTTAKSRKLAKDDRSRYRRHGTKKRMVENKILKGCKSNLFAAVQITLLAPLDSHTLS